MSNTKPKSSKVSFINYFPSDGAEEFLIRVRYQSYYHSVLLSSLLKEKNLTLRPLLLCLFFSGTPSAMISSFTTKFQESLQVSSPSSPEISTLNHWCSIEEVEAITSSLNSPSVASEEPILSNDTYESDDSDISWSPSQEIIGISSDESVSSWFPDSDSYLGDNDSIPDVYYDSHYFSEES